MATNPALATVQQPMPAGLQRGNGRRFGFTLLELMVVLVVAAVAMGLVVPHFGAALAGMELRAAARDVASALRFARGRAVSLQRETAVVIDLEARTYRIEGVGDDRTHDLGRNTGLHLITGRSEVRGDSEGAISFFPDGSSTGGRLTLDSGNRSHVVDVRWLTGRVSILDE